MFLARAMAALMAVMLSGARISAAMSVNTIDPKAMMIELVGG